MMREVLNAFAETVDAIDEPFFVSGRYEANDIVLEVPNAGAISVTAIDALMAASEPAPFGDGSKTRRDPDVRDARRLVARGEVVVRGFDPKSLLAEIEPVLSPREKLRATLTDVHVYPPGGHFVRHKDTPSERDMVGTLVVGLPLAYEGGAFHLEDGEREEILDWRGAPHWVAFFGDVDHAIAPVTSGHRVTLAYRLTLSGVGREPETDRAAPFRSLVTRLATTPGFFPGGGRILVPCTRLAIVDRRAPRGLGARDLRGVDRDLATGIEAKGVEMRVRPCLAIGDEKHADPTTAFEIAMLDAPLADATVRSFASLLTLAKEMTADEPIEPEEGKTWSLAQHVEGMATNVVPRHGARAAFIHRGLFSTSGYFGNEHFDAHLYAFAGIELAYGDLVARGLAEPAPPPSLKRVVHAKFGAGVVLSVDRERTEPMFEVRFADGTVRKVIRRFLKDA